MKRHYCKAYHVRDMKQFHGWVEKDLQTETEAKDDDIVYLWDDFTVVASPVIPDKGVIFDRVTSEWQEFCKTVLLFEIPEDLRSLYETEHG